MSPHIYIYKAANSLSSSSNKSKHPNKYSEKKRDKNNILSQSKILNKMVKPSSSSNCNERPSDQRSDSRYKGVRKRKWGKWVSEIRLPNSRERIWLGSYDSPEKAARAFDAALFCLRGETAKFNFPDNPPDIPGGRSLTPSEIQAAAASFANSGPRSSTTQSDNSSSSNSSEPQPESPSHSVSDGAAQMDSETTTTLDTSFLDHFATMGSDHIHSSVPDYGIFPGFDDFSNDFYIQPSLPNADYVEDNSDAVFTQGPSFLWNF